MPTLWNLVLVVSLLVLSAPQQCSGVDQGSLELRDVKLLAAMQVVSEALDCMTDTINGGFHLHENSSAAMVLMVKEQLNVQNEDIKSVKTQLAALQREDKLSEEIADVKKQVESRGNMVRHLDELVSNHTNTEQLLSNKVQVLEKRFMEHQEKEEQLEKTLVQLNNTVKAVTEENEDIEQQLRKKNEKWSASSQVRHLDELVSNHTNTEQLLSSKVQVLEKRIMEHQEKEEQLEKTLVQLNNTVAAQENDTCSALESQPHKQEIIRLVQQYNHTKDWESLRGGLWDVLDHSSVLHSQLDLIYFGESDALWHVGVYGYMQLVCLLLNNGLPVDTTGYEGSTLLHGAAAGGQLKMVKLLLYRGANVDARGKSAWTPLMYAAREGYLNVVQLLVSAGADTTARNKDGLTALDYARSSRYTAVVEYLQQLPH